MTLIVRWAQMTEKPRILEIAAKIWDGEDYVPHVYELDLVK
jgi:hypothetical protein